MGVALEEYHVSKHNSCEQLFNSLLLNQARAGRRPVRAWFLRIASVRECRYAGVCTVALKVALCDDEHVTTSTQR